MSKKQKMQPAIAEAVAAVVAVPVQPVATLIAVPGAAKTIEGLTMEKVETMTAAQLIAAYGNKSNAIRGLNAQFGMKPGPISKKLGLIYQHARNVLSKPLKKVIKEEREAAKAVDVPAATAAATEEVKSQVAA